MQTFTVIVGAYGARFYRSRPENAHHLNRAIWGRPMRTPLTADQVLA
jgi:hypothetical protein